MFVPNRPVNIVPYECNLFYHPSLVIGFEDGFDLFSLLLCGSSSTSFLYYPFRGLRNFKFLGKFTQFLWGPFNFLCNLAYLYFYVV